MFRQMLRSKIHRATVTEACLDYEGSLTVDEDLLEAAGIQPYEAIFCSNLNNGERFMTYAMKGKRGGGRNSPEWTDRSEGRRRGSDHYFLLRVLRRRRDPRASAENHHG